MAGSTLVGGSQFVPDTSVLEGGGGLGEGDSARLVACPVVGFPPITPTPGPGVSHTNVAKL
jgi:hypothetical protein